MISIPKSDLLDDRTLQAKHAFQQERERLRRELLNRIVEREMQRQTARGRTT